MINKEAPWGSILNLYHLIPLECKDQSIVNSLIRNSIKNNDLDSATEAFNFAKENQLATEDTYATYISAVGKNNDFKSVKAVFLEAQPLGLAGTLLFNRFIQMAKINSKPARALAAYKQAKTLGIANINTYNHVIDALASNGHYEKAKRIFNKISKSNEQDAPCPLPNKYTFAIFMDLAWKNEDFDSAKAAFEIAKKLGLADDVIYGSIIEIAGKYGDLPLVIKALNEAEERGIANVIIYTNAITAFGKNRDFIRALQVFEKCQFFRIANHITYNSFLEIAKENGEFEWATKAFNMGKELHLIDSIAYGVYIDILVAQGAIHHAMLLFKEGNLKYFTKHLDNGSVIDLHTLSHGAGIVALHLMCKDFKTNNPLKTRIPTVTCICGQGIPEKGNYLSFKTDLINYIRTTFLSARCLNHHTNPGCFKIIGLRCADF